MRKCRDSMKAPRLQVNRNSRMIGLLTCGLSLQSEAPRFASSEDCQNFRSLRNVELRMARKASSQRRLQILPPQMKLRSLSGCVAQGEARDSEYALVESS